ncbi:hypothetical protein KIW84_050385 [Lathyrus oleraceus]|uniref:CCHC-type domain-containing protein n=1 Tax=Pisum sativum TaxID=3888 RepID=A0A9D5ABZ9_PEA|nr:hypothetical protein KIW84_050385 [Pisum sativum]
MDKSLPELLAMPTKQGDKGKGKEVAKPKPTVAALKPSGGIVKEGTCFHCGKTGHWKRNCPKYLEDKKNGVETSTSVRELLLCTCN